MTIAVLLLLAAASADPALDCENALAQQDMNMCSLRDFERADAEMNAVWRRAAAAMKAADREMAGRDDMQPGYFATLLASQRGWLVYRDEHCRLESFEARGGSMQPMLDTGCKAQLTRERTRQLRELADGE